MFDVVRRNESSLSLMLYDDLGSGDLDSVSGGGKFRPVKVVFKRLGLALGFGFTSIFAGIELTMRVVAAAMIIFTVPFMPKAYLEHHLVPIAVTAALIGLAPFRMIASSTHHAYLEIRNQGYFHNEH